VSKKFKNCDLIVWVAERARSGFQGFDLILNELSELEHLIRRREWIDGKIRELAGICPKIVGFCFVSFAIISLT